ncbi:hypothetical protein JIN84_21100 [Luteolibacter yonseiensis]|uniref:Lipocalin-like domain-containing protein n=1 Tax=Luteolibacter yonseiensis TaxID=1144680 RepID=A0A934RAR7_9BACT|nr:hypothetical protein [Luteolibacter yonseiensis]MBK1818134.1 hypothetical protein [Luteolibacter yonseiensis]
MISRVLRWLALVALSTLLAACSLPTGTKSPGELGRLFTSTVPGTWSCQVKRDGIDSRMIKQFNPDGSARGVLLIKKKTNGVSFVLPEIPFTSRWRVVGDVVETYDIKTRASGPYKASDVIRDTLLSVSTDRIVSRSVDTGRIEILTRLKSER